MRLVRGAGNRLITPRANGIDRRILVLSSGKRNKARHSKYPLSRPKPSTFVQDAFGIWTSLLLTLCSAECPSMARIARTVSGAVVHFRPGCKRIPEVIGTRPKTTIDLDGRRTRRNTVEAPKDSS